MRCHWVQSYFPLDALRLSDLLSLLFGMLLFSTVLLAPLDALPLKVLALSLLPLGAVPIGVLLLSDCLNAISVVVVLIYMVLAGEIFR